MKSKRLGSEGTRSKSAPKSVEEYLARAPVPAGCTEVISYGMPAFRYRQVLVWYAAFASHCSFFPTPGVIKAFRNELKRYQTSKGTIQFPMGKPLPAPLVRKMVRARLAQLDDGKKH